ncbi:MAG: threonylcarbamoyl-AMP synthase [Robiginitomaculum sp.]|nr:MAG: threonylcarbamoyl-AMP synthase [Robiginitomaculum sp.]
MTPAPPDQQDRASAALLRGALVIVPTETVYGLAANVHHEDALKRLYAVKNRPLNQPISLLVADILMAERYGDFDGRARALAAAFWPGPLTLIVPVKADAPLCSLVLGAGTSIGLRVPDNRITRTLITQVDTALATPSANVAGAPAPTRVEDIASDLLCKAALCLDDGPCQRGKASTLVDASKAQLRILRTGDLSEADIRTAIGKATKP